MWRPKQLNLFSDSCSFGRDRRARLWEGWLNFIGRWKVSFSFARRCVDPTMDPLCLIDFVISAQTRQRFMKVCVRFRKSFSVEVACASVRRISSSISSTLKASCFRSFCSSKVLMFKSEFWFLLCLVYICFILFLDLLRSLLSSSEIVWSSTRSL